MKRCIHQVHSSRPSSPDFGAIIFLIFLCVAGVIVAIVLYKNKRNREQPVFVQTTQPQVIQMMAQPVSININNNVPVSQQPQTMQTNSNS